MGSSRPAFRDGQPSRRKEISRLSEFKSKTIAFKVVVFFVWLIVENKDAISNPAHLSRYCWPGIANACGCRVFQPGNV
jgi:hypothetical protein